MKKRLNKSLVILLAFLIIFTGQSPVFAQQTLESEANVKSLLVANADTGEVYYAKDTDTSYGVASMSKMMTYLVIKDELEEGLYKEDDLVKVTDAASKYAQPGYSKMDLVTGEIISIKNLLTGLMVVSANDAAAALAIKSSGTEDAFAKKMNEKAVEIGLENSIFVNASGLTISGDGEDVVDRYNQMSANDIYKLAKEIYNKYPETAEYSKQKQLIMTERNFIGEPSHNLFEVIPVLSGIKTGFTDVAGYNFTGYVDMKKLDPDKDFDIITVVIGASTPKVRREATQELIKYVNNNYSYRDLINYEKQLPIVYFNSSRTARKSIPLYLEKPFYGIYENSKTVQMDYEVYQDKTAPFEDGEVMGKVTIKSDGKIIGEVNLINKGFKAKLDTASLIIRKVKAIIKDLVLLF